MNNNANSKERAVDTFLNNEFKFKSFKFKSIDLMYVIVLWAAALLVRIKLYPVVSADYFGFLEIWMNEIKSVGPVKFLAGNTANYSSPYLYLMCLVSGFADSLAALKSVSVFFDYVACCAVFAIIWELTKDIRKSILGMSILLLCPTTILDGAYWCQCDIIYTSIILWALYFFFKDKSRVCFILLGVAFAFKLQTLFIFPFFVIMYLKGKNIKLLHVLYVPAVFAVAHIPAAICGKPIKEILTIYTSQAGYYPWGTLQYPNAYVLVDETIDSYHWMNEVSSAGTLFAIMVLGFIAYYICTRCFEMTNEIILSIAMFTVAIAVYFLPHMHDRYGFLIDLIAIIYAVIRPKRLPLLCAIFFVTVMTFMPYLIAVNVMSARTLAFIQTGIIVYMGYDLYCLIKNSPATEG